MAALGAGAASWLAPPAIAAVATGVVFETGARRRGLAGVMVSNGDDVAITDSEGRWSLPVARGDHVFVIEPPQWSSGAEPFAYLHDAALPRSIDFGLKRETQCAAFEALLFADTQAANAAELDYVRHGLLSCAAGANAAFALHHGDVMGDDLSLFMPYKRILEGTGLRWRHCPGNHDLDLDARDPACGFATWKREIGPTHFAFQHAGAVFILLNNVDYLGAGALPDGRRYRGRFGARQLRFVENVLRCTPEDALVVVSMHIPLASFDAPNSPSDTTADARDLMKLLARRPHTISFSGHSHTTEHHDLGPAHGFDRAAPHRHQVLTAASGSWWSGPADARGAPVADSRDGSPRGYHVLSVDGYHPSTRFVALSADAPPQVRVMARRRDEPARVIDGPIPREALPGVELLANVFDGRPATRARFSCNGRSFELTRTETVDPHVIESFERYRALCKPWVKAARSSHIWTAPLPPDLAPGAHDIILTIDSEAGTPHSGRIAIEIA